MYLSPKTWDYVAGKLLSPSVVWRACYATAVARRRAVLSLKAAVTVSYRLVSPVSALSLLPSVPLTPAPLWLSVCSRRRQRPRRVCPTSRSLTPGRRGTTTAAAAVGGGRLCTWVGSFLSSPSFPLWGVVAAVSILSTRCTSAPASFPPHMAPFLSLPLSLWGVVAAVSILSTRCTSAPASFPPHSPGVGLSSWSLLPSPPSCRQLSHPLAMSMINLEGQEHQRAPASPTSGTLIAQRC